MKSIYEKRYITSKQAQAAATKAGLAEGSYGITQDPSKIGGAIWMVKEIIHPALTTARQAMDAWITEFQTRIHTAQDIQALYDELNAKEGLAESVVAALDEEIGIRAEELEATRAITGKPAKEPKIEKEWIRESSVLKPTKLVWFIADELYAKAEEAGQPYPSRKEVQDECVRRGVASGTARTQFQHWFKCRAEMATAERAKIEDGKIVK